MKRNNFLSNLKVIITNLNDDKIKGIREKFGDLVG